MCKFRVMFGGSIFLQAVSSLEVKWIDALNYLSHDQSS